jgi:hypothetical protein
MLENRCEIHRIYYVLENFLMKSLSLLQSKKSGQIIYLPGLFISIYKLMRIETADRAIAATTKSERRV